MVKKGDSSGENFSSGTETWNVAQGYVNLKIMAPIWELDGLERISEYGTKNMEENILYTGEQIIQRRIEALSRFASTLLQVMGNVKFAIKSAKRKELTYCEEKTLRAKKYIKNVSIISSNSITHEEEINIDPVLFEMIFEMLREVKNQLNFPINESGLIFKESGEIDLDRMKQKLIEGG